MIVSQARPLSLTASSSGTDPLQSFYLGERSSFHGGLPARLSLAVTWRNLESRALGALLDSILLVPQFVQKCNKIQNLKVQLFWPLGENLGPKLNLRERWIEIKKRIWERTICLQNRHYFKWQSWYEWNSGTFDNFSDCTSVDRCKMRNEGCHQFWLSIYNDFTIQIERNLIAK